VISLPVDPATEVWLYGVLQRAELCTSCQVLGSNQGHKGCVNDVAWTGNVLASGASDRNIFLGELNVNEVK
jgi:WD40 repeat protein